MPDIDYSRYGILDKFILKGSSQGALTDKTFVVKDIIDVQGKITGAGNPTWRSSGKPAVKNASVVDQLLKAGASLVGKSATDEFACSLDGLNKHYPIPENPLYPDRIPGGSSSGSAVAVASDLADFAIGTDTVGSIRVPSAYCGIYGMRPGHGTIPMDGILPLGPTFDTVGLMSRNPNILKSVIEVLLNPLETGKKIDTVVIASSLFELVHDNFKDDLYKKCKSVASQFDYQNSIEINTKFLDIWSLAFSVARAYEGWSYYGKWMEKNDSKITDQIYARFLEGKTVTRSEYEYVFNIKYGAAKYINSILEENKILCLPTIWNEPPLLKSPEKDLAENRKQNIRLNIISVITGFPQLTIPFNSDGKKCLSLSFLGPKGSELALIDKATSLEI